MPFNSKLTTLSASRNRGQRQTCHLLLGLPAPQTSTTVNSLSHCGIATGIIHKRLASHKLRRMARLRTRGQLYVVLVVPNQHLSIESIDLHFHRPHVERKVEERFQNLIGQVVQIPPHGLGESGRSLNRF